MLARRIAVVDVEADAARAFRSMLEVLSGRTRCRWQIVDSIGDANVVVTSGHRPLPRPHDDATPVVAIVHSCDVRPRTPYVLTHPFRVMQVLSILDEIADESANLSDTASPAQTGRAPGIWEFAESVRSLSAAPAATAAHRAYTRDGRDVYVSGDLQTYACDAAVADAIRSGATTLTALSRTAARRVADAPAARPAAELLWHNAWHAATGLAPWLDGAATFRIRRWPDFGLIPARRAQLQIVAALARRDCTRADLARIVPSARADIERALNALSLCGLLAHSGRGLPPQRAPSAPEPPGFLRGLIDGLRDRLGRGR